MKISIVILVSLALLSHVVFAEQLPIERGRFTMTLPKNGKEISVSSYRPQEATSRSPIIFVLTGLNRNADDYTRHTSSCLCVGYVQSPESLTQVSSSGFLLLPPS